MSNIVVSLGALSGVGSTTTKDMKQHRTHGAVVTVDGGGDGTIALQGSYNGTAWFPVHVFGTTTAISLTNGQNRTIGGEWAYLRATWSGGVPAGSLTTRIILPSLPRVMGAVE